MVTTSTWLAVQSRSSDAYFREWGKGISDALTAVGIAASADTGQINWATVTAPGNSASAGYEIRYLNDSLHGTSPIYLKIDYMGSSTSNAIGIKIQIGTGSNGSGTITGELLAAQNHYETNSTTTQQTSYMSGDGGSAVAFLPAVNSTASYCPWFLLERSRDGGVYTGDGIVFSIGSAAVYNSWWAIKRSAPSGYSRWYYSGGYSSPLHLPTYINGVNNPTASATLSPDGTEAPVCPVPIMATGLPWWTLRSAVLTAPGDGGATGVFAATVDGSSRTYLGVSATYPKLFGCASSTYGFPGAIMWST